jgi:7-carboxy-7-deazaguanine synthase
LRCGYCDTAYAFKGGKKISLDDIMAEVKKYQAKYVTVTGGEPLAQKNCLALMQRLCDEGYNVSLETSGALDVSEVDSRVMKVVDLKTPASNECVKNLYSNIEYLSPHDQVKFVICNREDYDWSVQIMNQYKLPEKCEVLFSPSYKDLSGTTLADWIVHDQLPVRFQIQLHKILWQDQAGK